MVASHRQAGSSEAQVTATRPSRDAASVLMAEACGRCVTKCTGTAFSPRALPELAGNRQRARPSANKTWWGFIVT